MTLDLWTFDVGVAVASPEAYAEECLHRLEESWDSGADLVLFPEFCWMGLQRFVSGGDGLRGVSRLFWQDMLPRMSARLARANKTVVLGTCPFLDENTGTLRNRAPIFCAGRALCQDKLNLTPWEDALAPGERLLLWEFAGLRIAVVICLDIEVPELAAKLRGSGVDLILCPSATETILGVERVNRCASARAVELGCCVAVTHLVGKAESELIDENVGGPGFYTPSQSLFAQHERERRGVARTHGFHRERVEIDPALLAATRKMRAETNPSLLTLNEIAKLEIVSPILTNPNQTTNNKKQTAC